MVPKAFHAGSHKSHFRARPRETLVASVRFHPRGAYHLRVSQLTLGPLGNPPRRPAWSFTDRVRPPSRPLQLTLGPLGNPPRRRRSCPDHPGCSRLPSRPLQLTVASLGNPPRAARRHAVTTVPEGGWLCLVERPAPLMRACLAPGLFTARHDRYKLPLASLGHTAQSMGGIHAKTWAGHPAVRYDRHKLPLASLGNTAPPRVPFPAGPE